MPRVTIFNRLGEKLSYKMNVNTTGVGPGRVIPGGGSDGPHGDYAAGTTLTVWWRRGEVDVKTCDAPGCNVAGCDAKTNAVQRFDVKEVMGEELESLSHASLRPFLDIVQDVADLDLVHVLNGLVPGNLPNQLL